MQAPPWDEQHSFDDGHDMDEAALPTRTAHSLPDIPNQDAVDELSDLWDADSALGSDRT